MNDRYDDMYEAASRYYLQGEQELAGTPIELERVPLGTSSARLTPASGTERPTKFSM